MDQSFTKIDTEYALEIDPKISDREISDDLFVDQFIWSSAAENSPSTAPLLAAAADPAPGEANDALDKILQDALLSIGLYGDVLAPPSQSDSQVDPLVLDGSALSALLENILDQIKATPALDLELGLDSEAELVGFLDAYLGEHLQYRGFLGMFPRLFIPSATIDIEFHETGFCVWADPSGFYYGEINTRTGKLDTIHYYVEADPTPIREVKQGPEFIETADGLMAIGTTDDGLVYFGPDGSELLEGTAGYSIRFMPKEPVDHLYFTMFDADSNVYLYDDGEITALEDIDSEFPYWLSPTELLVMNAPGYAIYDLETGEFEQITTDPTLNLEIGTHATITPDGDRMILLAGETHSQLLIETEEGWEEYREIISPFEGFDGLYSAEFVEWQGSLWLSGFTLEEDGPDNGALAKVVLYDIENDQWYAVTAGFQAPRDPESVALDNGDIGIYYFDTVLGVPTTLYKTISPEDLVPYSEATADHELYVFEDIEPTDYELFF